MTMSGEAGTYFMLIYFLAFPLGALGTWITSWIELRPWRKSVGQHWTERARQLHPARVGVVLNGLFVPALIALWTYRLHPQQSWAVVGALAYVGGKLGFAPMERQLYPNLTFTRRLRLAAVVLVMHSIQWLTLLLAATFMPVELGWRTVVLAAGYFAVLVFLQLGGGLHVLRRMGVLHAASERLAAIVAEMSRTTGVTPRATWELDTPFVGAYAIPTRGVLMFTTGLLQAAPDDEVQTVCAHEMGHLTESRWVIAARVISGWMYLPVVFVQPVKHRFGGLGVIGIALAILLIRAGASRLSRAMERRADKAAASGVNAGPIYARALERIHRMNHIPAVTKKRTLATHPDLYDRLLAANVTPDYPRPLPPNSYPVTAVLLQVTLMIGYIATN
jgi:Zn-dependent protease with chaperone function